MYIYERFLSNFKAFFLDFKGEKESESFFLFVCFQMNQELVVNKFLSSFFISFFSPRKCV